MEWHASGKPTECPLRRHCLLQPRSLDPKPRSRSNIELKPCGWPCLCLLPSAGLPTFTMTAHWGTQQRTGLWMWARPMLHCPGGRNTPRDRAAENEVGSGGQGLAIWRATRASGGRAGGRSSLSSTQPLRASGVPEHRDVSLWRVGAGGVLTPHPPPPPRPQHWS